MASVELLHTSFTFHYGSILMTIAREYSALTAEFTFHYGSILIDLPITEASKDVVFTFHYGSILILLIMVITTFIIDLHSTMVLF